ncbi:MAG TPA: tyrosine--tRNA ligase, partial [Bacteroidota bacterium]|nr:tyrosine--tRNA ligase [Bacteroidota bacterium]
SPYRFYQFWYNTDDRDVAQYLKFFTLLPEQKILELEASIIASPEKREAQVTLAQEVTRMVHDETALAQALKASKIFFGGEISGVGEGELLDVFSDVPSVEIAKDQFAANGVPLIELLLTAGATKSKGESRRLLESGGIYLNNKTVSEVDRKVAINEAIHGKFIVLRKGRKSYFLVKVI